MFIEYPAEQTNDKRKRKDMLGPVHIEIAKIGTEIGSRSHEDLFTLTPSN